MFEHVHRRKTESRPRPAKGAISKASSMLMTAAVLAAMIAPSPVSAQLLNGNFENAPLPTNPFITLTVANNFAPSQNWKVTLGSVDYGIGPAGTTCHSAHCIDLNGNAPGRIEQTMMTGRVVGYSCTVTFFMSRHTGLTTATLTTFINGAQTSPATFTHNIAGVTPADGKWQSQSFTFTASGSDVLAFGTAMPANAGPQIDDVSMACTPPITPTPTAVNPCCPPWNTAALADNMSYQGVGGIGGQYTLKFTPSTLLNTQLTAYMAYVHAMVPTATSISVDFKMYDAGTGGSPVPGLAVSGSSTETWLTSGSPTPLTPTWFVTPPLTSTHMQIGRWYTIQTVIHLNSGAVFFSDSCSKVDLSVRLQVLGRAPNAPGGAGVLQFRMPDGKIVERSVKP